MKHVPFIRVSRGRDPAYETRRLKRRFAKVSQAYERAMHRRRQLSRTRQIALAVAAFVGAYAAGWMLLELLDGYWPV